MYLNNIYTVQHKIHKTIIMMKKETDNDHSVDFQFVFNNRFKGGNDFRNGHL